MKKIWGKGSIDFLRKGRHRKTSKSSHSMRFKPDILWLFPKDVSQTNANDQQESERRISKDKRQETAKVKLTRNSEESRNMEFLAMIDGTFVSCSQLLAFLLVKLTILEFCGCAEAVEGLKRKMKKLGKPIEGRNFSLASIQESQVILMKFDMGSTAWIRSPSKKWSSAFSLFHNGKCR